MKNLYQNRWNEIYLNLLKWYNRKRRHSALDYKTIEEFWKQKNNFKNVA
jgi:transposase InsO family protein